MTQQTPEERLQSLKNALKVFGIIQYAAPLLLVVLSVVVPALMGSDANASLKTMISGGLCVLALIEFCLFKFFLVKGLTRQIERLEARL